MRQLWFSILLIIISLGASAQKNDYLWPLGTGPTLSDFRFFFNFHTDPPSILLRNDTMSTGTFGSSYCNDAGELIAYTNGLWILNKNGEMIENAFGLNPTLTQGQTQGSYGGRRSGFFLGHPGSSDTIYFIHLDIGYHPENGWPYRYVGRNLMVTKLSMAANNGEGKAISKNEILLSGVLMMPTAVRHANGRDWWLLASDADENRHYRILLSPEGFSKPDTQLIGTKPNPVGKNNSGAGNAFSPNGQYYVEHNSYIGFSVFEFDRCSGLLANERRVEWPQSPNPDFLRPRPGFGNVFSSDDRLLYVTASYVDVPNPALPAGSIPYVFQFDLSVPDLAASIDTLNSIDTLRYFPYDYNQDVMWGAEMGADGRIYIVHNGLSYCTISYPKIRGEGCRFVYNEVDFGTIIGESIPVFPNYRLGPLDGSPCDTIGLNNIPVANFRVEDTLEIWSRYFHDLSYAEPTEWSWDFGDSSFSQDTSPVHLYTQPGKYTVCLTVSNTYGSHTYCRDVFVGITEQQEAKAEVQDILLFPNPVRETLSIQISGQPGKQVFLILSDILGRIVLQQPGETGSTILINLQGFKPGLYLVSAELPGGLYKTKKVFVKP